MVDPRGASGLASTIFHLYKPEAGPHPPTLHLSPLAFGYGGLVGIECNMQDGAAAPRRLPRAGF